MLKSIEKNNEINAIASGSTLEGDLVSSGDVRVDGVLNGSIKTEGRLVLGESGIIEGEVMCNTAIISGELKATIKTDGLLTLKSTAKLSGEIIAAQLSIEPGAVFTGKCSMGPVIKKMNKTDGSAIDEKSEKLA